jgi:uncharacterized protein YdcH (DUF465 family)
MFPEHRDLISALKTSDRHFEKLFNEHNDLDQKIRNMEAHLTPATNVEIENLKKAKLLLKDQLFAILQKAGKSA